jgi:hypothetical protein
MPVPMPIDAIAVLLLCHEPPPVLLASVVVTPAQTTAAPVIEAGSGFIVTVIAVKQPEGNA